MSEMMEVVNETPLFDTATVQRGFDSRETWMADLLMDAARSIPDSPERLALLAMAEIEMMRIRGFCGTE